MTCISALLTDGHVEGVGIGDVLATLGWDVGVASWSSYTISTAVWDVTVAGDDEDWASKLVDASGLTTNCQELANGHRLA